jgi:5-methylcytosine-specific restriction protein A
MARREFSKSVKIQIIMRASKERAPSEIPFDACKCELCGAATKGRFAIDHIDPDGLQTDKSKPLMAAAGQLLCLPCHADKTKGDVANIAKAKRREARHIGAHKPAGNLRGPGFAKAERKHEARPALPPKVLFR